MIKRIIAKRKASGLTITELRRRCCAWKFTRFRWVNLNSALRISHLLTTFKKRVLKKIGKTHGKTTVLEFLFFSFSFIFQKRAFSRGIFLQIFQIFDKTFFKEQLRAAVSITYLNRPKPKTFSKLAIKQSTFWCLYSVLWYLDMISCIWLEEKDLWWNLSS